MQLKRAARSVGQPLAEVKGRRVHFARLDFLRERIKNEKCRGRPIPRLQCRFQSQTSTTSGGSSEVRPWRVSPTGNMACSSSSVSATSAPSR